MTAVRRASALAAFMAIATFLPLASAQSPAPSNAARGRPAEASGRPPVLIVETAKGTFSIETFPEEAPRTVAHIVELAQEHFYDGQRIHRSIPGFVIQFGDPQSRDLSKRPSWGRGATAASGKPIGAAEMSRKRPHVAGAVGVAHSGDPRKADSQIYVTLKARPDLDGQYAVFGQVVEGADVPAMLEIGDVVSRMYVRP